MAAAKTPKNPDLCIECQALPPLGLMFGTYLKRCEPCTDQYRGRRLVARQAKLQRLASRIAAAGAESK